MICTKASPKPLRFINLFRELEPVLRDNAIYNQCYNPPSEVFQSSRPDPELAWEFHRRIARELCSNEGSLEELRLILSSYIEMEVLRKRRFTWLLSSTTFGASYALNSILAHVAIEFLKLHHVSLSIEMNSLLDDVTGEHFCGGEGERCEFSPHSATYRTGSGVVSKTFDVVVVRHGAVSLVDIDPVE